MNTVSRGNFIIALAASTLTITGCAVYPVQQDYAYGQYSNGPPAYAPAHGYRTINHAPNMVYDSHLGVYVLLDLPDHYYFNNVYYRYNRNNWFYRYKDTDKWRKFDKRKLPPGLARKYQDDDRRNNRDWHS